MVNHLGTYLLNTSRSDYFFVDPSYQPQPGTLAQEAIRQAVYPRLANDEYRAFITRALTTVCLSSDHAPTLLSIDPRYPRGLDPLPDFQHSLRVLHHETEEPVTSLAFQVGGQLLGDPIEGVFHARFELKIESPAQISVFNIETEQSRMLDVEFVNQESNVLTLDERSNIWVRFIGIDEIPEDFRCIVEARAPMTYSIPDLRLRLAGNPRGMEIFGNIKDPEVRLELLQSFQQSDRDNEAVSAILTAFALSFE